MRIVVFSDLHGNFENVKGFKGLRSLFFLGDVFTNFDFVKLIGRDFVEFYKRKISAVELKNRFLKVKENLKQAKASFAVPEFFKNNEIFTLPGNHETIEYYERLGKLPNVQDFHQKKLRIKGREIIGHGGIISPHNEIALEEYFIYSDKQVAENLKALNPGKNCIILMHELPLEENHAETRKAIQEIKPKLVIGGHDHRQSIKNFQIKGINYVASGMRGEIREVEI